MFGINISKPTVKQQLMIGGVVVVFLFLTYFIYVKYVVPLINKRDSANLEHNTQKDGIQQKNVEVMFFFADWCPHCTKAKPHWNKLKSSETVGKGKVVNGYSILYTEVDCTNDKDPAVQEKLNKFKVEGFPTIKLIKGNEVIEFDAQPETETLEQFIITSLNN